MLGLGLWLGLGLCAAGPAAAVEFVETLGPLSDEDFYYLVACGAPPGGACIDPIVRWAEADALSLTVSVAPVAPSYPKALGKEMLAALDRAIAEINGAQARLRLLRAEPGEVGRIRLFLTPVGENQPIRGTGISGVDGVEIGAGLTTVWWNDRREITEAVIVMAGDLPVPQVFPVLLEELTQSLGLLTDIRNPWYETRSVFSEDSNSVTRLGPQDVMALRRHYP